MSLSNLASLGSFVSGVAVLISLVFLYSQVRQVNRQVRQAERNQQAMITQARTTRSVDIRLRFLEPNLASTFLRAHRNEADLSDVEIFQFQSYAWSMFLHWEDSYYQHKAGLMSDQAFRNVLNLARGAMRGAPTRVFWRRVRAYFEPDFRDSLDQLADDGPALSVDVRQAEWWAEVAAEMTPGSPPAAST